jgi:hypothetical protein
MRRLRIHGKNGVSGLGMLLTNNAFPSDRWLGTIAVYEDDAFRLLLHRRTRNAAFLAEIVEESCIDTIPFQDKVLWWIAP